MSHRAQVMLTGTFDWCIRYFKTYYPQQSWETWSKHLYWGHFHEFLTAPFILKRLDGDYCVCHALRVRDILVIHPVEGEISYLKTAFNQFFYNEVLGYQVAFQFHLDKPLSKQIIQQFCQFLWQKPKRLMAVLSIFSCYELCAFIQPFGLSFLIEHLDFFSNNLDFCFVGLFLGFGMGLVWSLSYLRQRLSVYCLGINAHYFAIFVWSKYFLASLSDISKQRIADVYPRLVSLDQMAYRLLQQFVNLCFDVLFLSLNLMILGFISLKLACLDLLSFMLLLGLSIMLVISYQRNSRALLSQQQHLQAFSLEMLQHMNETKLWQQEHLFFGKWKKKNKSYWQAFLDNEFQQFKLDWLIDGIKKINFLVIVTFALYLIKHQELSLGFLIAYLSLKIQVFGRFEGMLRRINQSQYFKASLEKLSQLFQTIITKKVSKSRQIKSLNHDITIEHIEFKGQRFKNLYFQRGINYLIDGPSGCGKTSLLKAIMGLSSPMNVKLTYLGNNCQKDDWHALRRDVSIILPEQSLWQGSLIDNITMFASRPDIPYLQRLCMDLAIDMDLDVDIERLMTPLSAGQKQKVLLARALYRRPQWLILDEATCHLDEDTEQKILMRLLDYPCSLIVINHRQYVAKFFDQRLVWDELFSC